MKNNNDTSVIDVRDRSQIIIQPSKFSSLSHEERIQIINELSNISNSDNKDSEYSFMLPGATNRYIKLALSIFKSRIAETVLSILTFNWI